MDIVVFTKKSFIACEFKKIHTNNNVIIIKDLFEIYSLNIEDNTFIFCYHLDSDDDFINTNNILDKDFLKCKKIALRNNTNNIEGCSLLKKGYSAYIHSISNHNILNEVIKSVKNGNKWIYPELMQFLISSIPLIETSKDAYLDKISIKELEVLELIAEGLSNNQISEIMNIAIITVKKHVSSLFNKLEQKDRLSLALFFKNSQ